MGYPLANKQLDPENHHVLMETSLPTPICQGLVYVNLPEGNRIIRWFPSWGLGILYRWMQPEIPWKIPIANG